MHHQNEPLFTVRHLPLKRLCDLLGSYFLLLFLAPLLLCVALLVKLSSRGPILYRDLRVGRGGRLFYCYKYRSMYLDADRRLEELLEKNPEARMEWETHRKLRQDPRITPLGYWLRRTSIDELPQLWNCLIGDMSIVGPRPVSPEEMQVRYGEKAMKILRVRPGLTGLWQISGRSRVSYATRIALDEHYVDKRCGFLDFKILLKTIPAVLLLRGAY